MVLVDARRRFGSVALAVHRRSRSRRCHPFAAPVPPSRSCSSCSRSSRRRTSRPPVGSPTTTGRSTRRRSRPVAAAGVMPGCTTRHFCPKTVVTKGKMAVYLARALHLKATVKTKFRDVPKLAGERRQEGRGGRDHEGLRDDALLPEHGDHPRADGRPAGQGAAPDSHRQFQVQGRLEAPQVRDGHRPTRDGRAGRHLCDG